MNFSVGKILLTILAVIFAIVIGVYIYLAWHDIRRSTGLKCGPPRIGRTKSGGFVSVQQCHSRHSAVRVDAKGRVPPGYVVEPSSGLLVRAHGEQGKKIIKGHVKKMRKIEGEKEKGRREMRKKIHKQARAFAGKSGEPVDMYVKDDSNPEHTTVYMNSE